MGTYNKTKADMTCLRCGSDAEFEVDLYFGDTTDMHTVKIGDAYPFRIGRAPQNGGPLPEDQPLGKGYTECPLCQKDFHCLAEIRDGRLVGVRPDLEALPLIPDEEIRGDLKCPDCGNLNTRFQSFNGYSAGRLICDGAGCRSSSLVEGTK